MGHTLSLEKRRERRETDRPRSAVTGRARADTHEPAAVGPLAAHEARANAGPRVHQLAALRDALNPVQREAASPSNRTGMPDRLKGGLESLSGFDLSGVRVHYNSSKPAQLNAHAFTQGKDIHVAPGQERHLPHEGWHAVQQLQGRVRATTQLRSTPINDEGHLEREADVMGPRALQLHTRDGKTVQSEKAPSLEQGGLLTQRVKILNVGSGTDPSSLMRGGLGDTVVNIDSGHMALAGLLMKERVAFFKRLRKDLHLPFKEQAFEKMTQGLSQPKADDLYRQFIIRSLFERFPGEKGFWSLLDQLTGMIPNLWYMWALEIGELEEEMNFRQGFVENLGAATLGLGEVDQVHAISALGFDLVTNREEIRAIVRALKPGGRLIITAEKTGMVSKAMEFEGRGWNRQPVLDLNGKPVLKEDLPLFEYFRYLPAESDFGSYADVFVKSYPGMTTSHTTGGGFQGDVPFVRLVFQLTQEGKDQEEKQQEFNLHTPESEFDAYEFF